MCSLQFDKKNVYDSHLSLVHKKTKCIIDRDKSKIDEKVVNKKNVTFESMQTSSTKDNSENYISSVHEVKKPHKCPICDYSCTRKTNLKKHIDTIYEGKKLHKPYKCSICDYSCTKKSNLDDHIYAVHEGKKPHQCYICDYSCATKSNMSQHINTVHEGKKPHKCSICD